MTNWRSGIIPTWCPGCEDYVIYAGLQGTLAKMNLDQDKTVIVYDIGCIGNMADFVKAWGVHSLHGRCIPTAVGIKLANPELNVIAIGGDGGIYGEGLSHLVAAARLNIDITVIVANNHLYSLTTGQSSPTTPRGTKTKSTPHGVPSVALIPVELIKTVNPEVDAEHINCKEPLKVNEAMERAISKKGFHLLDLEQLCVSFGKQLIREKA